MQAVMIELVDGSSAIGWIKALFISSYKPGASVKGIITKLVKHGIKQYFKNGKQDVKSFMLWS